MTRRFSSNPVRLAVTLGDPGGIGPEVALKALARRKGSPDEEIVFFGKASFYTALSKRLRLQLAFYDLNDPQAKAARSKSFPCLHQDRFPAVIHMGRAVALQTRLAVRSIELAVQLAMEGVIDAVVTPPINKAGLKQAGFNIPGHTEYLAKLAGASQVEMMLVGGPLRVVLATRHAPIRLVPRLLTARRIEETIRMTAHELRHSFGIAKPRIVVCGLNPHAGESGTIGREELEVITPAVRRMKKQLKHAVIEGPLSPDALFVDAYRGRWDAEVCMYHDQGLIPLKMISRGGGVNVTLGLPFVRTSPDHGTAYDIAGLGKADPGSFSEALDLAVQMVRHRRKQHDHACC